MLSILGSDDDSYSIRREIIDIGIQSFAQRPLVGWGPENFYAAYDANVTADAFSRMAATVDQPHNKIIEELATKGVIGFIPYITILLLIGVVYIRYLWNRSNAHWDLRVGNRVLAVARWRRCTITRPGGCWMAGQKVFSS